MSPFPVILSAPSGGGKTTIARQLLEVRADVGYSVSCTTREPRADEVEGVDYYFLSRKEFRAAIDRGEFAEAAQVHGEFYGTLLREVERVIGSGRHVIMDIDVQGARQFVRSYPESVLIFIIPPSAEVLLERLHARRTEDSEAVARRLESAIEELRSVEVYDYLVVNDDLRLAVDRVSAVIDAESVRRPRSPGLDARIKQMIAALEAAIEAKPSN